jgi:hypothetical protein
MYIQVPSTTHSNVLNAYRLNNLTQDINIIENQKNRTFSKPVFGFQKPLKTGLNRFHVKPFTVAVKQLEANWPYWQCDAGRIV